MKLSEMIHKNEWADGVAELERQRTELLEALKEIAKGEGPFKMDRLEHCESVVGHLISIAEAAIAKAEDREPIPVVANSGTE